MSKRSHLLAAFLVVFVLGGLASVVALRRTVDSEREDHGPWLTRHRGREQGPSNWFMNQRRSADAIPLRARAREVEALEAKATSMGGPGTWVVAGPLNVGGRVTALGVDPNNPNHLWLGTAAGGVFTSLDSGTNWTPVFDNQTALSIGSLAVHPTNSSIVYVGTGEDNGGGFSYDGEGVFKTVNGGASWSNMGLAAVRRIGSIAVDPTSPDRVFVAAGGDWFTKSIDRGIYRSLDGGVTWTKVLYVADDAGGIDLAIDPSNPNRIFAAIWQRYSAGTSWYIGGPASGIYRSLDGGTTWTELVSGLPSAPGRIGLAIAPSSPQTVYACIINDQGRLDGIYRSTDSGDVWAKVSGATLPNQFSSYSYYFSLIRVHPTDADIIYALDVQLWRLKFGMNPETPGTIANGVHVDWHALIVEAGGRWLGGTDGGFYRTSATDPNPPPNNWFHAVTLPITQFYDLGIDRQQPQRRFAGAQDNYTQRTITGGLSDWTPRIGGDGLQCEVDYTNSNKVYGESQYGGIQRSTNGGDSFVNAVTGIDPADRTNWNAPITLDPVVPSTLYTATYRVYRSTNSAQSWSLISADLSNGHPHEAARRPSGKDDADDTSHLQNLVDGTITVVSVSPVDPQILWVGTDDGNVWVSTNWGASYTEVNPPGLAYWVTDIEPDRFDASTAYLAVTGYRTGDKLPYVRVTRDLGASWEDLSGGLPQVPVSTVLPSSEWRGRLFAGNDIGVFLSDDDGLTWSFLHDGMPYAVVMDLVENLTSRRVFAGTHARSIYTYDLDQLPPADGDGDGVDNNADCALRDAGAFASPDEVSSLNVTKNQIQRGGDADTAALSWSSLAAQAGPGTVYDLAIGDLADLAAGGTSGSTSLVCGVAGTAFTDTTPVLAGQGVYYLVRGRNACGLGSWGTDSQGTERSSSACP